MKQFFVNYLAYVCFYSVFLTYSAPLVSSNFEVGCCTTPVRVIISLILGRTENTSQQLLPIVQSQITSKAHASSSDDCIMEAGCSNDEASSGNASLVSACIGGKSKSDNNLDLSRTVTSSSTASSPIDAFKQHPFPDELLEPLRKFVTFESAVYLEVHPF